jgi:endonuclease G
MRFLITLMFIILSLNACTAPQPSKNVKDNIPSIPSSWQSYKIQTDLHSYAGLPVSKSPKYVTYTILKNKAFTIAYDEIHGNPAWVCYKVPGKVKFTKNTNKRPSWKIDKRTKAKIKSSDYTHTGFDRGHLAPNRVIYQRYGEDARKETFLMSNATPQYPNLNRGLWKKIEDLVSVKWSKECGEIWVITGVQMWIPKDDKNFKGRQNLTDFTSPRKSKISAPFYCYKIILAINGGKLRAMAFKIKNTKSIEKSGDLSKYLVSIDQIEEHTNLELLQELPEDVEEKLEAEKAKKLW